MTQQISESPISIRFPYHKLIATGKTVSIIKNKAILNNYVYAWLAIIGVIIVLFRVLPQSPSNVPEPYDFGKFITDPGTIMIVLFSIGFIIMTTYFGYKRLGRAVSNFVIVKADVLTVNGERIDDSIPKESVCVVIPDVAASGLITRKFGWAFWH
jgi:hypothetical protein